MSEPEQEGTRLFAFFRNNGQPMDEEAHETWSRVRDEAFPIPIVCGTKPPDWSVAAVACDKGCHTTIVAVDCANDESYIIREVPVFVARASGMVDDEGRINPALEHAEAVRLQASLN